MEEKSDYKASWNMSGGLIQELQELRSKANLNYINNNLDVSTRCLISIMMSVISSFTQEERMQLNDIKNKLMLRLTLIRQYKNRGFKKVDSDYLIVLNSANKLYEEMNELLMDCLHKHGYLIGEMKDQSKMIF